MRVLVLHSTYGCDTGCCGHSIEVQEIVDGRWETIKQQFDFSHPWKARDDFKQWAEDLVRSEYGEDHVKDLDWENCFVSDD
jgi:hypothetical protein